MGHSKAPHSAPLGSPSIGCGTGLLGTLLEAELSPPKRPSQSYIRAAYLPRPRGLGAGHREVRQLHPERLKEPRASPAAPLPELGAQGEGC